MSKSGEAYIRMMEQDGHDDARLHFEWLEMEWEYETSKTK